MRPSDVGQEFVPILTPVVIPYDTQHPMLDFRWLAYRINPASQVRNSSTYELTVKTWETPDIPIPTIEQFIAEDALWQAEQVAAKVDTEARAASVSPIVAKIEATLQGKPIDGLTQEEQALLNLLASQLLMAQLGYVKDGKFDFPQPPKADGAAVVEASIKG